jgi:hypothetical protein
MDFSFGFTLNGATALTPKFSSSETSIAADYGTLHTVQQHRKNSIAAFDPVLVSLVVGSNTPGRPAAALLIANSPTANLPNGNGFRRASPTQG